MPKKSKSKKDKGSDNLRKERKKKKQEKNLRRLINNTINDACMKHFPVFKQLHHQKDTFRKLLYNAASNNRDVRSLIIPFIHALFMSVDDPNTHQTLWAEHYSHENENQKKNDIEVLMKLMIQHTSNVIDDMKKEEPKDFKRYNKRRADIRADQKRKHSYQGAVATLMDAMLYLREEVHSGWWPHFGIHNKDYEEDKIEESLEDEMTCSLSYVERKCQAYILRYLKNTCNGFNMFGKLRDSADRAHSLSKHALGFDVLHKEVTEPNLNRLVSGYVNCTYELNSDAGESDSDSGSDDSSDSDDDDNDDDDNDDKPTGKSHKADYASKKKTQHFGKRVATPLHMRPSDRVQNDEICKSIAELLLDRGVF